ncbi:hypothetical protein SAMN04515665_110112 [Blastococcus sp. DSM 46786]|nr:hypothetical protein SAMN04515665_110112 [Blastococcus sp. DSM 46786]
MTGSVRTQPVGIREQALRRDAGQVQGGVRP